MGVESMRAFQCGFGDKVPAPTLRVVAGYEFLVDDRPVLRDVDGQCDQKPLAHER